MESKIKYTVYFPGLGYYAKVQRTYDWCHTSDLTKALFYETYEGANERALWGISLYKQGTNKENHSEFAEIHVVNIMYDINEILVPEKNSPPELTPEQNMKLLNKACR